MVTLSPRLAAVADLVLPGLPVADIGTDHGYLPVYLVQAERIPRAVASDISPGPLEAARRTVAAEGLGDRIDLRLGPGLSVLQPGEAATVVIAGMGDDLVASILDEAAATGRLAGVRRLVLQPMGTGETVRQWLASHGWRLVAERLVAEGRHIYVILAAEPGEMHLTEGELLVGPCLRRDGDPLLVPYVMRLLDQSRRALAGARQARGPAGQARAALLQRRIQQLEEVLTDVEGDHRNDHRPAGGTGAS
ncbi:MAG TPA: class I SAM-dependent methyltransferase [Symbiobacteriaceae bacterium]